MIRGMWRWRHATFSRQKSKTGWKKQGIREEMEHLQQQKGRPLKIHGGMATTGRSDVGY
jgi:hypothetical protein